MIVGCDQGWRSLIGGADCVLPGVVRSILLFYGTDVYG